MGVKNLVKQMLTEKENRRYGRRLAEKKVSYGCWLAEQERQWSQPGPIAQGDFVLICAGEGEPAPYAEKNIADFFAENPQTQVVYGDEDVLTREGEHKAPWFKPDWSPDLLDSCLYFGSLFAVRRSLWRELKESYERRYPGSWERLFGEEKEGEACRVRDLEAYEKWLHDCVEGGYEQGTRRVGHIPQILFHARSEGQQMLFMRESPYLWARKAELVKNLSESLKREDRKPLVSVVIPSKDQPDILEQCVESVRAGTDIPVEIIVVDNGSSPENRARTEGLLKETASRGQSGRALAVRYLYRPMEFHFSRMCNLGAEAAEGKLLLFLNDDVFLRRGCIDEMAARALRSYTGAVGLKLLYPGTERIQHAGITNLPMGPVHKLQSLSDEREYYGRANRGDRNFLAVTAACLMVEKKKFPEAGGFCEELRVAFNDVDFCFRLHELGYFNVCLNDIWAYHHESLSRGDDEAPEKLNRLLGERKKLYERHPALEGRDPYYSRFLNSDGLDVRIAPAYQTAGNRLQTGGVWKPVEDIGVYREDKCLLVRPEDVRDGKIVGWSVVLGDNNACYERTLLLRREDSGTARGKENCREHEKDVDCEAPAVIYGITLEGQYRPDLEENMPDQTNVALCGFMLELPRLPDPEGSFQIGICVRSRVTGLRLVNWSSRRVEMTGTAGPKAS